MTLPSPGWLPADTLRSGVPRGAVTQTMVADLLTRGDGWERGVRLVRLENDRVSLEIAVDRGMDIPAARIDGIPVAWRSPVPVTGPWYSEAAGHGTQRGFYGGLLTTGGLDHVGAPSTETSDLYGYPARAGRDLPLHGRLSGSPARLLGYGVRDENHVPVAWAEGEVTQVSAFGEHLVLHRRIALAWGSTTIEIDDTVANRGYAASPLGLLYHVNAGWPVVQPGSMVHVLGSESALGLVGEVDPAALEAVRHLDARRSSTADARVTGVLGDGSRIGLGVAWNPEQLPGVAEWRVRKGSGHYAVGLEPTTLLPPGADAAPMMLEPGRSRRAGVRLTLTRGA